MGRATPPKGDVLREGPCAPGGGEVAVEVVAALSCAVVCRVRARTALELKAAVERVCGVRSGDQRLVFGSGLLEGECWLSDLANAADVVVVQLLQVASVVGATKRALGRLGGSRDDARGAIEALDKELVGTPLQGMEEDLQEAFSAVLRRALAEPCSSESCADVALSLDSHFRQQAVRGPGGVPSTFAGVVTLGCIEQLRSFPFNICGLFAPVAREWTSAEMLAMMRFMGSLISRGALLRILRVRIGNQFIRYTAQPEERHVECICELLTHSLPAAPQPQQRAAGFLASWARRLQMLKDMVDPVSQTPLYSDGLRARMQIAADLALPEALSR